MKLMSITNQKINANQKYERAFHTNQDGQQKQKERKQIFARMWTDVGPLCTVGRKVKWCSHYGKQYGNSSKKLKVFYDPVIPLVGINLN